jgi:hypothetical protein
MEGALVYIRTRGWTMLDGAMTLRREQMHVCVCIHAAAGKVGGQGRHRAYA